MDPLTVAAMREQLYLADVARTMPGFRYIALAEWATNYGISLLDRIDAQAKRIKELEAERDALRAEMAALREQIAMLRQPTVAVCMAYDAGREAGRAEVRS